MRTEVIVLPGWDDIYDECRHNPKGAHGIHNDEWHFHVHSDDGLTAMCLSVGSRIFPATIPERHWRGEKDTKPSGRDLSLFARFAIGPEAVRHGPPELDMDVDIFSCRTGYTTALGAGELWDKHGVPGEGKDQPQSFWDALKAKFKEWDAAARGDRSDLKYSRCDKCDGAGVVERDGAIQR